MGMYALIGFGGSIVIVGLFLTIYGSRFSHRQKLLFFVIVYVISLATSILSDIVLKVGYMQSVVIAGIGAPFIYCFLLFLITRVQNTSISSDSQQASNATSSTQKSISPIIIAAIVQAIGTIVAAIIATLN